MVALLQYPKIDFPKNLRHVISYDSLTLTSDQLEHVKPTCSIQKEVDTVKQEEAFSRATEATPFGSAPRNSISRLFRHVMR